MGQVVGENVRQEARQIQAGGELGGVEHLEGHLILIQNVDIRVNMP